MTDEYAERRGLTFAQAEGVEPLPTQLVLGELSQPLRVRLSKVLLESLNTDCQSDSVGYGDSWVGGRWGRILYDKHILFDHKFPDEYSNKFRFQYDQLSLLLKTGSYIDVLGCIQFILQHSSCPYQLDDRVGWALRSAQAAYRVIEGGLIVPTASEAEAHAVSRAFADLKGNEFNGARHHLGEAAKLLTAGSWADSVRESIHAVEAIAKLLEPSESTLGAALGKLAKAQHVHAALKEGLSKLYGYTNDEEGIRHALLADGDAQVDEVDAHYMFGACASFVTYLIGKGRASKLIK